MIFYRSNDLASSTNTWISQTDQSNTCGPYLHRSLFQPNSKSENYELDDDNFFSSITTGKDNASSIVFKKVRNR